MSEIEALANVSMADMHRRAMEDAIADVERGGHKVDRCVQCSCVMLASRAHMGSYGAPYCADHRRDCSPQCLPCALEAREGEA